VVPSLAVGRRSELIATLVDDERPRTPPRRVRLVRVRVPLLRPHRSAHGTDLHRDVVLVEWTRADGVVGWGECPTLSTPGYVTGTTEQAWQLLLSDLGPAAMHGRLLQRHGASAPTGALADACLDAELRSLGRSLASFLGARRPAVARTVVVADVGGDVGALAARAVDAVGGGARLIKVKVEPGDDVDRIRAVQSAIGSTPVAADANGSYADASQLDELDRLGLAYLEQPLPPGRPWDELALARRRLRTPIAWDESLTSVVEIDAALRAEAVDVVSIKPARLGGVQAAARAVRRCEAAGLPAFVGGMLELGIGRAAAAAVASMSGCTLPTDLGPSDAYVEQDVCEPVTVDPAGELMVPSGPGCGRTPDPALLGAVTVDEVVLTS
jgi:O-succinylbenzoate synthase